MTALRAKKPYKSWLKDGTPSSMDILVRWLTSKSNYVQWRGEGCTDRIAKKILLDSIVKEMYGAGIYHREAKDIASKISTLQSNYRSAREWSSMEGERWLQAGVSTAAVHEELLKRFPYWDELDPVMGRFEGPMSIQRLVHVDKGTWKKGRIELLGSKEARTRAHTQPVEEARLEELMMIERWRTQRLKAKADLVRLLLEAGFSKSEIEQHLQEDAFISAAPHGLHSLP